MLNWNIQKIPVSLGLNHTRMEGRVNPGVDADQGDAQQTGRVHGVQPPRLHLRPEPQPPQQPAGRARLHQAQGAHARPDQLHFRLEVSAGLGNEYRVRQTRSGHLDLAGPSG